MNNYRIKIYGFKLGYFKCFEGSLSEVSKLFQQYTRTYGLHHFDLEKI